MTDWMRQQVERDTLKKQLLIEWERQLNMDEEVKHKYQQQLQLEESMKELLEKTKKEVTFFFHHLSLPLRPTDF